MFLQLFVNGVVTGAVYALMALGFGIVYNTTRIFHIAHGAIYSLGGYIFFTLAVLLKLNFYASFLLVLPLSGVAGLLVEWAVYRPVRRRQGGLMAMFIVSLGLTIFLQNLFAFVYGEDVKTLVPGPLPTYRVGDITVTPVHLLVVATCLVVFPIVHFYLTRTRSGKAIRALSSNPELTPIVGIPVERIYLLVLALGSSMAGVAGALLSLDLGVRPGLGFVVILYAIVSVIVGGVGYLPGAALGGFLLGLSQNLILWRVSVKWQDVVIFGILFAFLIFRPQGIFGRFFVVRQA